MIQSRIHKALFSHLPPFEAPLPGLNTLPRCCSASSKPPYKSFNSSMNLYNELWGLWRVLTEMWFIPKPTFSVDQIPDLSGQVILVTGEV